MLIRYWGAISHFLWEGPKSVVSPFLSGGSRFKCNFLTCSLGVGLSMLEADMIKLYMNSSNSNSNNGLPSFSAVDSFLTSSGDCTLRVRVFKGNSFFLIFFLIQIFTFKYSYRRIRNLSKKNIIEDIYVKSTILNFVRKILLLHFIQFILGFLWKKTKQKNNILKINYK